jgi:hypothetical protein
MAPRYLLTEVSDMPNLYVEPRPKGRPEGTPIEDYVLEFAGGRHVAGPFRTQADHWRSCS